MCPPHFRLRTLLVVVAVVAVVLAGSGMARRRAICRDRIAEHLARKREWRRWAYAGGPDLSPDRLWHLRLKESLEDWWIGRWERAARYPWLPLPAYLDDPDPARRRVTMAALVEHNRAWKKTNPEPWLPVAPDPPDPPP